jgi:ribosome-associated translation inhibitor RaiA
VDIVIHSHHAEVSEHMRKRAVRAVEKAAARIPRIVEGIIRFEEDGPVRRVTVTLRAPKHHDLMGKGEGRFYGPSLVQAIAKVNAQASREKRSHGRAGGKRPARNRD